MHGTVAPLGSLVREVGAPVAGHVVKHVAELRIVRERTPVTEGAPNLMTGCSAVERPYGAPSCNFLVSQSLGAELLNLGRHLVEVRARHAHRTGWRRFQRHRLCRVDVASRAHDGPLFQPEDRLAAHAVEE